MISLGEVSHVVAAIIPLYVAMFLAYASVKWCNLFSPEQCSGINKFVAKFSIPLLSFKIISETNPYKMNLKVILSDVLQKAFALIVLVAVTKIKPKGGLRWIISGLALSTLPNTLIVGIPLIRPMYGDEAAGLLAQIVVLQSIIWFNILLFLYEFCAAKEVSGTIPVSESIEGSTEPSQEAQANEEGQEAGDKPETRRNKTMHILKIVGKKLINNPNTHATVLGLIWACIHFRLNVELPDYVDKSISILGDGGLGMAMFSIGLFMASRPKIIACGTKLAMLTMVMRMIMGPALMAASSLAVGLRGTIFRFSVVQASLPLGVVPFIYAREYNMYPEIFSTGIVFGMIVAVPVALGYYILLAI